MIVNRTLLIIILFFPSWSHSAFVANDMQKLGQGQAYYLGFIKVYDASLYTSELSGEQDILSVDVSKCLYLEYSVSIESEDFVKAAKTVLNRQFSEKQLVRVHDDIETLHQGYRDVRDGDSYTLCYNSTDKVTTLSYNDTVLVSVDSSDFAQVYFSIWLGRSDPLDKKLRDDLLAGLQDK